MPKEKKKAQTFEEFQKEYGDCPEELFKMAKTPFERAVAVEFFNVIKNQEKTQKDIEWLKWLIVSMFGVTLTAILGQFALQFLNII